MFLTFAVTCVISTPVIPPPGEKVTETPYFNRTAVASIALFLPTRKIRCPIPDGVTVWCVGYPVHPASDPRTIPPRRPRDRACGRDDRDMRDRSPRCAPHPGAGRDRRSTYTGRFGKFTALLA